MIFPVLVAAIGFKLTWLYWLLAAALAGVLLRLRATSAKSMA